MNILDLIIILPLIWATYQGYQNGFWQSVGQFFAVFLAILGAVRYGAYFEANILQTWTQVQGFEKIIAFVLVFFVLLLIFYVCIWLLANKIFPLLRLVWLDKTLGAVVSFLKTALFLGIILLLLDWADSQHHYVISSRIKQGSFFYGMLVNFAEQVIALLAQNTYVIDLRNQLKHLAE
jgi:membrane protein required for colicin V production